MPERCPGDYSHLYSFFKHENVFYHVREGDLFGGLKSYYLAELFPQSDLASR
jgi:hypothetical protein